MECSGDEYFVGYVTRNQCAVACYDNSSLFAYGTNDYGKLRCKSDGKCKCLCEDPGNQNGWCSMTPNDGYRLYRYINLRGKISFLLSTIH